MYHKITKDQRRIDSRESIPWNAETTPMLQKWSE